MATHVLIEHAGDHLGSIEAAPEQSRREPLADREPRGVDRLRTVVRLLAGDAFRPRRRTVRVEELEEKDATLRDHARRDSEWLLQREANLAEYDAIEAQHGRW